MKRYLFLALTLLLPTVTFGASMAISPNTTSISTASISITCDDNRDNGGEILVYLHNNESPAWMSINQQPTCSFDTTLNDWLGLSEGEVVTVMALYNPDSGSGTSNLTYDEALGVEGVENLGTVFTFGVTGGLGDLVSTDKNAFLATVGFGFDDVVGWSGNMIKMIFGNGLALVSTLIPYIIALLVILAVVGLIYRGFRFMRH